MTYPIPSQAVNRGNAERARQGALAAAERAERDAAASTLQARA